MSKSKLLFRDRIKTVEIHIVRALVRIFYIFPLKQNRIVFFSYYGKQYSCNPRTISEYIVDNYAQKYEIIWAFLNPEKYSYLEERGIKCVRYKSIKRLYLQATAKYTINNCGAYSWMPTRNGQVHVNTWHAGGAYKRLTTGTSYNRHLTAKETTHMISGCEWFTKYNIHDCFEYQGTVLSIGMPRNDVFFDVDKMQTIGRKVKNSLGLKESEFMVLYAPTWRYDGNIPHPDFEALKKAVEHKYQRKARIVGRSHSVKAESFNEIIDATGYPDMQDLLCAADMLITDYSSSIWDYSFTYRPCLLYVEDLDKYMTEQGFLTDIYKWGFPICRNSSELVNEINSINEAKIHKNMDKHHEDFGSYETGKATISFYEAVFE